MYKYESEAECGAEHGRQKKNKHRRRGKKAKASTGVHIE